MSFKRIFVGTAALSMLAAPIAAEAATASSTANPAAALSLGKSARAGKPSKGEHIGQAGWIVGIGMIAIGAGAIVLAVDDDNDRPDSN